MESTRGARAVKPEARRSASMVSGKLVEVCITGNKTPGLFVGGWCAPSKAVQNVGEANKRAVLSSHVMDFLGTSAGSSDRRGAKRETKDGGMGGVAEKAWGT